MNFQYYKINHHKILITWTPIQQEQLFLLSFHVVKNAEPFSIIIYPQMIQYEKDYVYCVVSIPPFTFGKIQLSSFSELNPDTSKPIRSQELDYVGQPFYHYY